jgi:hypothetical protein
MPTNSFFSTPSLGRSLRLSIVTILALAPAALAGGFQLSVETPDATIAAQQKKAVLVVRTFGCHTPADASITAKADGLVNGKRQSLDLELRPVGTGVYTIEKQWGSEGAWVVTVSGAYNGMTSSLLVELGANGSVRPGTKIAEGQLKGRYARAERRKFTDKEIDDALRALTGSIGRAHDSKPAFRSTPVIASGLGALLFLGGFVAIARRRAR